MEYNSKLNIQLSLYTERYTTSLEAVRTSTFERAAEKPGHTKNTMKGI